MKITYLSDFKTKCTHKSGAVIETDIPEEFGGEGKLFAPTDLIGVGLATCMLTSMGYAAKQLGFEFKGATAEVEKTMSDASPRRIAKIVVRIRCPKAPNGQIQEKLERKALDCPVHRSLHPDVKTEVDFVWGL